MEPYLFSPYMPLWRGQGNLHFFHSFHSSCCIETHNIHISKSDFRSRLLEKGKYELRLAIKKLYNLRPKVSTSRASIASRVVNPKHEELRPAVCK